MKELRNELTVLMEELGSLAVRNEELLADREEDAATIRRLEEESQEYKRRWEVTKTDLRNLKGMFLFLIYQIIVIAHLPSCH